MPAAASRETRGTKRPAALANAPPVLTLLWVPALLVPFVCESAALRAAMYDWFVVVSMYMSVEGILLHWPMGSSVNGGLWFSAVLSV